MSPEINFKIFELTYAVYRVTDLFSRDEVLKRQIREKANEILSGTHESLAGENNKEKMKETLARIQSIRSYLAMARLARIVKAVNAAVLDREYDFFVRFFEHELDNLVNDITAGKNGKEREKTEIPQPQILTGKPDNRLPQTNRLKKPLVERSFIYSQKVSLENGNGYHNNEQYKKNAGDELAGEVNEVNRQLTGRQNNDSHSFLNDLNERQKTIYDFIKTNQTVKSSELSNIFSNKFSIKTLQRDLASLISQNIIEREGDKRWAIYKTKI